MIPASGDMMSELPPAMQGMRRRRFVDKDGDTFYATGTFRHIRLEWAGASIVFRNEDADRIAALILAVRPEPFSEARITVIPDEAVEVASKVLYESRYMDLRTWGDLDAADQDEIREEQRLALEAAAPHLLSQVSTLDELLLLEPGTVIQGPDFHGETYKCTAPGTFHAIASPTEYRPSELVGRGPFKIIHRD